MENNNSAALNQAAREMEYIAGEMRNIALHFSDYLADFTGYFPVSPDAELPVTERDTLIQRIKSYEEALNFPVRIVLFFRGGTRLYTSGGVILYRDFETDIQNEGDLTMSSFYTSISSLRHTLSLRLSPGFFSGRGAAAGVAYLHPLPYLSMIPQATLCFVFRGSDIRNIFENYLGAVRGDLYLFNEMLRPLYSEENLGLPESFTRILGSIKGVGAQERQINRGRYIVMRSISENTGQSLISIMRKGDFFAQIGGMRFILLFSITLLELAILAFAVAMTMRNYQPIRSLLNNIGGSVWEHRNSGKNEFDFILDRVNSMEEVNQELSHVLDRQRPMVAGSCLRGLLTEDYDNMEEMDYYLKCANINLSGPWFFVLLIVPRREQPEIADMNRQIQMIFSAADRKNVNQCRLYCVDLISEQQVAVIVSAAEKNYGNGDVRQADAEFLINRLDGGFNLKVKIGSGRIYDSPLKISASFLEAKVAADYLLEKRNLMCFEEAVHSGSRNYRYPVIEQSLYIQSIKQANTEMALKAMDAMVARAAEAEAVPVVQCLCFDIINTMMKLASQLDSEISLEDLRLLAGFTDLDQFRRKSRELTGEICRKFGEMRKQKNSRFKSDLINYVNEHFCEARFGLQELADHFDVSFTYLSRFFKQETGHNFVDYVSMLRMDKAKELLLNTGKQIKEIVYDVGYMDAASFLRKFRAQEGITPGQYRERMRFKPGSPDKPAIV